MIWANLAMLGAGGALLSVPVLIHFLMKPKPIEADFPALRFLKEKQLINRSRSQLRHLLLLLLRCLLIGLLVLALAGPAVASQEFGKWLTFGGISFIAALLGLVLMLSISSGTPNKLLNRILGGFLALTLLLAGWYGLKLFDKEASGQLLGDSGEPVSALIVLDTSPTMQYELENETRLAKGKTIAKWLVNQFPSGSQVCIAAPDVDRVFFSVDQGAAIRRIDSLETCFNPKTIPETLGKGFPLVEESPLERKEVYIVSDLSRRGWSESTEPAVNRLIQQDTIPLFVVDVGVEDPVDFRLDALELSGRQITSGGSLSIKAAVNRLGPAAEREVKLSIEKLDKTRPVISNGSTLFPENFRELTQLVDIFENGTSNVAFQFQEDLQPGTYHGKVEVVGGDPLSIDDEQFFTFEVSSPWQALIVRPEGTETKVLDDVLGYSGSFETTVVDQANLENFSDFDKYSAIFLVDPQPLNDNVWGMLEQFVESGGGLGVFLGNNAATREGLPDPSFQTVAASRILTGKLSNAFRCPDRIQEPFVFSPQNYSHPVLSPFRENSTSIPWAEYPVFTFWGLDRENMDDEFSAVDVIVYNNFEPALVERRIGSGRILVMTTPVSEPVNLRNRKRWNQRPPRIFEWFVIVRGITRFVVQADSDALDVRVGDIASLRNDSDEFPDSWKVFSPDPERPPAKIGMVNNSVTYSNTDLPGHYRLKGVLEGPVLRGFSANIDPQTVDLSRIIAEDLDKVLGAGRYELAKEQDEITRKQGQARKGREFYPLLMMMMFAAIVIEYLVSNRFYKH
jgi:hypothetical protein